jgi:hypothetical protein
VGLFCCLVWGVTVREHATRTIFARPSHRILTPDLSCEYTPHTGGRLRHDSGARAVVHILFTVLLAAPLAIGTPPYTQTGPLFLFTTPDWTLAAPLDAKGATALFITGSEGFTFHAPKIASSGKKAAKGCIVKIANARLSPLALSTTKGPSYAGVAGSGLAGAKLRLSLRVPWPYTAAHDGSGERLPLKDPAIPYAFLLPKGSTVAAGSSGASFTKVMRGERWMGTDAALPPPKSISPPYIPLSAGNLPPSRLALRPCRGAGPRAPRGQEVHPPANPRCIYLHRRLLGRRFPG